MNTQDVHIDLNRMMEDMFHISINEYFELSEFNKQRVAYFLISTLNQELIRDKLYNPIYRDLFALAQNKFEENEEYEKSDIIKRAKNILENI